MTEVNSEIPNESLEEANFTPLEDDEIVTEMIRCMVSKPEAVSVRARLDKENNQKILRIETDPMDCGQVIGRHGWMATFLRYYLGVVGSRQGHYILIEIVGKDGVPQNPLLPYNTHDLENLQNHSNNQDAGQKAIAAIEALRDAFDSIEQPRQEYRPRDRSQFGPPRHFRSRNP